MAAFAARPLRRPAWVVSLLPDRIVKDDLSLAPPIEAGRRLAVLAGAVEVTPRLRRRHRGPSSPPRSPGAQRTRLRATLLLAPAPHRATGAVSVRKPADKLCRAFRLVAVTL